jgi:hypothetical protein
MAETVLRGAGLNLCRTRPGSCGVVTFRSRWFNGVLKTGSRMLNGRLIRPLASSLLIFGCHGVTFLVSTFYWSRCGGL